jgi:hypothetical protein
LRDYSEPLVHEGLNNIVPPFANGVPTEYAVYFGTYQNADWDAQGNWWGTAAPDQVETLLFSDTSKIDYSNWEQAECQSAEDFYRALELRVRTVSLGDSFSRSSRETEGGQFVTQP